MQSIAYLKIDNQKILVLYRHKKTSRQLKKRESGNDGVYLEDESRYLESDRTLLSELKSGKPIEL